METEILQKEILKGTKTMRVGEAFALAWMMHASFGIGRNYTDKTIRDTPIGEVADELFLDLVDVFEQGVVKGGNSEDPTKLHSIIEHELLTQSHLKTELKDFGVFRFWGYDFFKFKSEQ